MSLYSSLRYWRRVVTPAASSPSFKASFNTLFFFLCGRHLTQVRRASSMLLVKSSVPSSLFPGVGNTHSTSTALTLKTTNTKTPLEYIADVAPIEVDGATAVCDGGGIPALGHPIEFIQLNKVDPNQPETCKYCGLRFIQSSHH